MDREIKGAPWLGGWILASMVAIIAFFLCLWIGEFEFTPSVAIAGLLFVVTGGALSWLASFPAPAPAPQQSSAAVAPAPKDAPPMGELTDVGAPVVAPLNAVPANPASNTVAAKPPVLAAARQGMADDLKIIRGIGPKLEVLCNRLGFYHVDQVAGWTAAEIKWVDENLEGFKGRVTRDRWVPQARAIVELGATEFLAQLDAGKQF